MSRLEWLCWGSYRNSTSTKCKDYKACLRAPTQVSWRFCRGVNGTEGFSISLEVGADGEVRGQLRNDEEMGKWMKAKPEEYEIKCLRGPNRPGRHTKSENNWQRTRKNRKAKIQDIIFFKTFQRTGVKRTESYEGMIKTRISEFNIWRIKFI